MHVMLFYPAVDHGMLAETTLWVQPMIVPNVLGGSGQQVLPWRSRAGICRSSGSCVDSSSSVLLESRVACFDVPPVAVSGFFPAGFLFSRNISISTVVPLFYIST